MPERVLYYFNMFIFFVLEALFGYLSNPLLSLLGSHFIHVAILFQILLSFFGAFKSNVNLYRFSFAFLWWFVFEGASNSELAFGLYLFLGILNHLFLFHLSLEPAEGFLGVGSHLLGSPSAYFVCYSVPALSISVVICVRVLVHLPNSLHSWRVHLPELALGCFRRCSTTSGSEDG